MTAQSTGWRSMPAAMPVVELPHTTEKSQLFEAARLCARALGLSATCRYVLEQLCGVYGGELVEDRMLVWPSNDFLCERTGIPERSIRYALRQLVDAGIITAKDSPNGKRFAQRSTQGQIIKAFGFDLSPLINRLTEFRDQVQAMKDAEREREATFDEMTVHRRATQEALRAIAERFPTIDITALTAKTFDLSRRTPRRGTKSDVTSFREEWEALRDEAETVFYTASAGNTGRHKDRNKYTPENPCNSGNEKGVGQRPVHPGADARDLARTCPEAMEFVGPVHSDREFIGRVGQLRGAFGVSPSAWEEACAAIGPLVAAATLVYVVQLQIMPTRAADPIRNPGGYFRRLAQLIRDGHFNLAAELAKMRPRV